MASEYKIARDAAAQQIERVADLLAEHAASLKKPPNASAAANPTNPFREISRPPRHPR